MLIPLGRLVFSTKKFQLKLHSFGNPVVLKNRMIGEFKRPDLNNVDVIGCHLLPPGVNPIAVNKRIISSYLILLKILSLLLSGRPKGNDEKSNKANDLSVEIFKPEKPPNLGRPVNHLAGNIQLNYGVQ